MQIIDTVQEKGWQEQFAAFFRNNRQQIGMNDIPVIRNAREEAMIQLGRTGGKAGKWNDLDKLFTRPYRYDFSPASGKVDIDRIFHCEVPDFKAHTLSMLNGWYVYKESPLVTLPGGIITGSLAAGFRMFPGLFEKHYNRYCENETGGLVALNTAFAQDGIFIYVPDGAETDKTIQMVNVFNREDDFMIQNRNLVILGKNSRLTLVHCDDSQNQKASFSNTVTEIYLDEGARLDHYKLQNINDNSTIINHTYLFLEKESWAKSHAICLNGGVIRNFTHAGLHGTGSQADIFGLYLVDKEQQVDNRVFVDHASPDTRSNELFKGITDDHATSTFNGHILVRKDAQRTNAFQTNRNIVLTDKAVVNTRPFLEIFADDVRCSHGATVGQLDENAMFYIRSRGIGEASARLLLMYAFAAEVIGTISIASLRKRIDDLVKKRLRGELAICDQCVLHCSSQDKSYAFEIDMSKI